MKKVIILFVLLLTGLCAEGQTWKKDGNFPGVEFWGVRAKRSFMLPVNTSPADTVLATDTTGMLRYNQKDTSWRGFVDGVGWMKINGGGSSGISSANPSATVGLTAINGSASTFMRSDAAPAINQAIIPTWTGQHKFTFSSTQSTPSVQIDASNPQLDFLASGAAVDARRWNFIAGPTSFGLRTLNDAGSAGSNIWSLTRSGNGVSLQNWYIANVSKMALGANNFESFVPTTIVTGTDGNKLWLAKYVSGTGHNNAPTVIGATSTLIQVGGREYGNNGYAGIGFGYVSAATDHPAVWIGHRETATAGNTAGDLIVATRAGTANIAPTPRFHITSAGDISATTSYRPTTDSSLVPKKYVDSMVLSHIGQVDEFFITTNDTVTSGDLNKMIAPFSTVPLANDKTEVRLFEVDLYVSGPEEAGIRFWFNNTNGTITYNGGAIIPTSIAPFTTVWQDYDDTAKNFFDPLIGKIRLVQLKMYVTSAPTGGSYGSLHFLASQETPFATPVIIHAGSKMTVRLISSQ